MSNLDLVRSLDAIARALSNRVTQYFSILRQDNTTTTSKTVRIESGWGVITMNGAAYNVEPVTFSQPFGSIPIVVITHAGDANTGAPTTYGTGGNTVHGLVSAKVFAQTTSGFQAMVGQSQGSAYPSGNLVWYNWIAIGE